jgi:hypothetical protein
VSRDPSKPTPSLAARWSRRLAVAAAATLPLVVVVWIVWGDTALLILGRADPATEAPSFPPPASHPGRHELVLLDTRRIVPGDGLPAQVVQLAANNNLDAVRHSDGRVYLAWRTAPDHFASAETRVQVVSSVDELSWRFEHAIHLGTDIREPRLLSLGGRLLLYVSQLGTDPTDFEPRGIFVTERGEDGRWSALSSVGLPGYIGWRARLEGGRAYMVAYVGGERMYDLDSTPLRIDLLTSADGHQWSPVDPDRRSVYVGGGSEADFTLDGDGHLRAVIRNEAGDDFAGWGSLICTAPPDALADWSCRPDGRKFDSPHVFRHDGEVYLAARRDVSADGRFDAGLGFGILRTIYNQAAYVMRAKRCAVWRFVIGADGPDVVFVRDLPSRGDTCFPAVLPGQHRDEVVIYDYSSPLDGPDSPWSVALRRPTEIHRHALRFAPRAGGDAR